MPLSGVRPCRVSLPLKGPIKGGPSAGPQRVAPSRVSLNGPLKGPLKGPCRNTLEGFPQGAPKGFPRKGVPSWGRKGSSLKGGFGGRNRTLKGNAPVSNSGKGNLPGPNLKGEPERVEPRADVFTLSRRTLLGGNMEIWLFLRSLGCVRVIYAVEMKTRRWACFSVLFHVPLPLCHLKASPFGPFGFPL